MGWSQYKRKVKILPNEKADIEELIERLKNTTLMIQSCLLKGIRLDELYLHGTELVSIALLIQYHCQKISLNNERSV